MTAVGTRDFELSSHNGGSELLAAVGAGEHPVFQRFFNALGIKAHNELAVDLKGRHAHDLVGYQCLTGTDILCNVPFNIGDVLF